jgi:hypothetical protein
MPVKFNLNLPSNLWTQNDSVILGQNTLAQIKIRTGKGIDANGQPFAEYSTNPIYIQKKGAKLKPKGGKPTKSGDSVFYQDGYAQYKHESRRRGQGRESAEVDLVLSGNMLNNFIVKEATDTGFKIGLTNQAEYGYDVNQDREFIGLTDGEVAVIVKAVELDLKRKLQ